MDFNLDASSLGVIISIFLAIFFSRSFVSSVTDNVLRVVRALFDMSYNAALANLFERETLVPKSKIELLMKPRERKYSELQRSLECNISLCVWFYFFALVLFFVSATGIAEISDKQIFISLCYMFVLPYIFKFLWHVFDTKLPHPPNFSKIIENKLLLVRYPPVFFIGAVSFQLLFVDFPTLFENRLYGSAAIVSWIFALYLIVALSLIFYRIFKLSNNSGRVHDNFEIEELCRIGEAAERRALILSVLISAALTKLVSYLIFDDRNFDPTLAIYLLPLCTIVFSIFVFFRNFDVRVAYDFLVKRNPL